MTDEGPKPSDIKRPCEFNDPIKIGKRARGAIVAAAGRQRDAQLKLLDGLGQKYAWRRDVHARAKFLQDLQDGAGDAMGHQSRRRCDVEQAGGGSVWSGLMNLFGNVEQLFIRETDHRPAHEGTERKPVARIRQRAQQRQDVLGLLLQEERLAGLRRDGKPERLQCAFVAPEFGAGWSEKCDVARLEEAAVCQCARLRFRWRR